MRANNMEVGDVAFEDLEGLLREINEFCASNVNKPEEIPQSLERYFKYVAKTGNTVFPWQHVRPLFRHKILQSMDQFPGEMCPIVESFVMERFDLFRSAPFTIQRLSELVTQPTRHYKKKDKFLRGLEKTVLVVSTVEPWSIDNDSRNGNESTSASDGEMDVTYSESEDSAAANRTFTLDPENEIIVATGAVHGQGDGGMNHGIGLSSLPLSCGEGPIDSVTTTMVNITSNGNQSTTTILSSTTSSSNVVEGVPATSELGLSAVVASIGEGSGADQNQQTSEALMQLDIERAAAVEAASAIAESGDSFTTSTTSAVLDGLEMTTVELGHVSDSAVTDEHNILGSTTLNVERVEIAASAVINQIEVKDEAMGEEPAAATEPQDIPIVAASTQEAATTEVLDSSGEKDVLLSVEPDVPVEKDTTEATEQLQSENSTVVPEIETTTMVTANKNEVEIQTTIPTGCETIETTTSTIVAEENPLQVSDEQQKEGSAALEATIKEENPSSETTSNTVDQLQLSEGDIKPETETPTDSETKPVATNTDSSPSTS